MIPLLTVSIGHNVPDDGEEEPGGEEWRGEAEDGPQPRGADHRGEEVFQISAEESWYHTGINIPIQIR